MSMNDFVNMLSTEQKLALLKALQDNSPTVSPVPEEVRQETVNHINDTTPVDKNNISDDFRVSSIKNTNNGKRREPVRGRENRWKDEGEFRDIETPKFEKTPRRRDPPRKVDVECHVCGRTFKEDARYVYGEYPRCNRCTGK